MIDFGPGFLKDRANLNFNWMRFRAHGTTDHEMDASIADRANFRSQIGFTEGLQDLLRVPFPMIRDRSFDLFPKVLRVVQNWFPLTLE